LRELGKNAQMSPTQRREKSRIMQQILRNDAQVRLLTEPWVAELERLLRPAASGALH
ncbi:MAG: flagellar protein FliT, partial [Betaproteobacteria bacterium]|nr:flagellar protein FliT [Betaproteobacteria bacterium]